MKTFYIEVVAQYNQRLKLILAIRRHNIDQLYLYDYLICNMLRPLRHIANGLNTTRTVEFNYNDWYNFLKIKITPESRAKHVFLKTFQLTEADAKH